MNQAIHLRILRLQEDARLPEQATSGSAGIDLYSCGVVNHNEQHNLLKVSTGLSVAFPSSHAMLVLPRSGLATKLGLTLANSPALIDSDYRGEIFLVFKYTKGAMEEAYDALAPGNRVAQILMVPTPNVVPFEVSELDETERGSGGFGSSGES